MTLRTRFVTGLGRSHPVENGFAWHHTLGLPYLSASSFKGLTRAAARLVLDARDENRIFGLKFASHAPKDSVGTESKLAAAGGTTALHRREGAPETFV